METTNCKNEIINRALSLLREKEIIDISIEPNSDTEKLVYKWYETAKSEALLEVEPIFAIKRLKLNIEKKVNAEDLSEVKTPEENSDTIVNNSYLYAYRIPSDCLRIFDGNFELLEGNYIYSYQDNGLTIKYLTSNTELYTREVKFNIALSYLLAYYICADLQNNDNKIQLFFKLKNNKISEARISNLREIGVEIKKNYRWKK